MSFRPLVLAVLLSACSDFDQLGRDARCRVTNCDAGVGADAGLDAGPPDAGDVDAGEDAGFTDAGLLSLQPLWAQADFVPEMFYTPRPGFIAAAGSSRVVHLREFVQLIVGPELYPDSGVAFPAGSILGDVVQLELATGDFVLEDGGRSSAPTDLALRGYLPGERTTPTTRGALLFVPSSERLVDGGALSAPDGGPLVFGDVVMAFVMPTLEQVPYPTGPAKGATSLGLPDGGGTLSWIPPGNDAGMFSVDDVMFTQTGGLDCPVPIIDVVTTLRTRNNTPDHRLVQLAECRPDALSIIAWSRDAPPEVSPLALLQEARGGRLGIGPESLNRRNPYVAWKGGDSLVHLTRFNEEGTNVVSTRVVSRLAQGARIGAVAVDGSNSPLVIIEAPSIGFLDLQADVSAPGTELILASFQENLDLRWAASLSGVNRLRVNSATFVGDALVLDVSCPRANLQAGDFCRNDRSTWAVRVGLADGGFPP